MADAEIFHPIYTAEGEMIYTAEGRVIYIEIEIPICEPVNQDNAPTSASLDCPLVP